MKRYKTIIGIIIFLVFTIISLGIISISNLQRIKTDNHQNAEKITEYTESFLLLQRVNADCENYILLIITNEKNYINADSLLSCLIDARAIVDLTYKNLGFFEQGVEYSLLVTKEDSLSAVTSQILDKYNVGELESAREIFQMTYYPLYSEINLLCESVILKSIDNNIEFESKIEKNRLDVMRINIGLFGLIVFSMIGIILLLGKTNRNIIRQQKEISELTLRNKISQESIENDNRFHAAIQAAGFGVIKWDFSDNIPVVNKKWLEIFEVSNEEIDKLGINVALSKIISISGLSIEKMKHKFLTADRNEFHSIFSVTNSKMGIIWVESFDFILERDKNGQPQSVFGFIKDISESKNSEIKIQESLKLLNATSKAGKIGHWEFDVSKPKPNVSDEWLEVFSIKREDYENGQYVDWINNMSVESQSIAIQNHREIVQGIRKTFCTEYMYNHPEKGEIWIEGYGEVSTYDKYGRVQKYIGYHQDITRRKKIEEEYIRKAEELKSWYRNMNLAFCVCEKVFNKQNEFIDLKYLFVNEQFCNTVNLSEFDLVNKFAGEFLHSSIAESVIDRLNKLDDEKSIRFDIYDTFLKKDFEIFAFDISENKFAMLYSDVSERFLLQNKIAEEQKYYRQLFELSRDAIFIIDSENLTFIDANNACVNLFGAEKKSDLMAIKYSMLYPAKQINGEYSSVLLKIALKNIEKSGEENYDWIFRKINGQEFIGQIKFTKIEYQNRIAYLGIVRDTTQIYNTHESLEQTRQWLQTIIDSLSSVVVVKDNYGKVIASNQTYNRIFGVSKEFVIGKKATEIYKLDEAKAIQAIDDEIIYLGHSRTYEQRLTTAENKQQVFLITKTPLKDSKGNVYAIVAQGTDISTIKTLENKLREVQHKAVAANQAKSSFLANMSHEIRTPMNAIIGFAEILQKKLTNPDHKEYINSIYTAGNTLLNLINDILDLSKIEAGKIELRPIYCDLEIISTNLREIFKNKIEEKDLEFFIEYSNPREVLFFIDENRLRQVLINIIGNAIKFTNKGFIKVQFLTEMLNNSTAKISISIEDTGCGIAQDEIENIFNPFCQSANPEHKDIGGTGLGLSICNQLIGLMNGKIEVESKLEKGTKFTIIIPDVTFEIAQTGFLKQSPVFVDYIFSPAKILIVDDVKSNRDVLAVHLRDYMLDVFEASSGSQAIDMLEKVMPDLIIIDLIMPDINGVEVAKIIRKSERNASVKIIAYTAAINFAIVNEKLNPIFDGLLIKPVTKSALTQELIKILKHEELKLEGKKSNMDFSFCNQSISLMKEALNSVSAYNDSRLTNRQISEILLKLRESDIFEEDTELQRYVQSLAKAVEDFNVILTEHLLGVLFFTNEK